MPNITAIKVKVFRYPNKHFDYPDFSGLPSVVTAASGGAECEFMGGGKFDRTSCIEKATEGSPIGERWLMKIVSPSFATEAITDYPTRVFQMTEAEATEFWDDKAHGHMSDTRRDANELQALHAEFLLLQDLSEEAPGDQTLQDRLTALRLHVARAIDPDDETPGIRTQRNRRWANAKEDVGGNFIDP